MELVTNYGEILLRVLMATVCGGLLGWERERKGKPAGFRTQMMVCLGAASFTLITIELFYSTVGLQSEPRVDLIRVIEGVVGGIGFLGAGTIIQARGNVEGITTAATIWVVGALGVACGAGFYFIAVITVVFALIILRVLSIFEWRYLRKSSAKSRE